VVDCLFCAVVAGEIAGDVVHETAGTLAFRDINPQAPTHVLVISKQHYADVAALTRAEPEVASELLAAAAAVAEQEGIADAGWRLVFNTGPDAGQSVPHVHGHVLGGRRLSWPPG
jgi:histidine triad (HIT) family protein